MVVTFCQICDMHSIVFFHISALHTSDTIYIKLMHQVREHDV